MTGNQAVVWIMRQTFEAMDAAGCFRQTSVPPAYAAALRAQQAAKAKL